MELESNIATLGADIPTVLPDVVNPINEGNNLIISLTPGTVLESYDAANAAGNQLPIQIFSGGATYTGFNYNRIVISDNIFLDVD